MIIAVLEKRAELRLAADDVFVNVAGGVKVAEPAIDLAIALAIASAPHRTARSPPGTLAVGELGLGGEVRSVPQLEQRLREAARLGLGHAIVPHIGGTRPEARRHVFVASSTIATGLGGSVTAKMVFSCEIALNCRQFCMQGRSGSDCLCNDG